MYDQSLDPRTGRSARERAALLYNNIAVNEGDPSVDNGIPRAGSMRRPYSADGSATVGG